MVPRLCTMEILRYYLQQRLLISPEKESISSAYFLLGEMVEMGDTQKIFTNPDDKRTEDYVNGRFG